QSGSEIVKCRQVLLIRWRAHAVAEPPSGGRELSARLFLEPGSPVTGRFLEPRARLVLKCGERSGERVGEVSPDPRIAGTRLAGQAPREFHPDMPRGRPECQIRDLLGR